MAAPSASRSCCWLLPRDAGAYGGRVFVLQRFGGGDQDFVPAGFDEGQRAFNLGPMEPAGNWPSANMPWL